MGIGEGSVTLPVRATDLWTQNINKTSTTVVKLPRPSLNFHNRSSILLIYLSHPAVLPVRFYQLIKGPPNQILSNMRPSR